MYLINHIHTYQNVQTTSDDAQQAKEHASYIISALGLDAIACPMEKDAIFSNAHTYHKHQANRFSVRHFGVKVRAIPDVYYYNEKTQPQECALQVLKGQQWRVFYKDKGYEISNTESLEMTEDLQTKLRLQKLHLPNCQDGTVFAINTIRDERIKS